MDQLVGEEAPPSGRLRRVAPPTKDDVVANGVGCRIEILSGLSRPVVDMDAHPRKVVAEARFHLRSQVASDRAPGALQDIPHRSKYARGHRPWLGGMPTEKARFFLILVARSVPTGVIPAPLEQRL
jgi:hypothetical protein